jgi:succinoglycan biosynthesis transport protein ExoP
VGKRSQLLFRQTELRERIRNLEQAIKEGKSADVLPVLQATGVGPDGKQMVGVRYVEEPILPLILKEQELLEDFGEDHPQVKSIRKRIETMRAHLQKISPQSAESDPAKRVLAALQFELSETEMTLRSLGEVLEKMKTDARSLGNDEIQETHLRNDVARMQLIYEGTIKRLQEINLTRGGGFDARSLSTPGIGGKVAPIAYQDLTAGLVLGLLLGAGLAYLADMSDKSFRNPEEIRRRLGLPLVGHIPFLTGDAETERKRAAGEATVDPLLCTHFRTKSLEAEAYRAVRTALYFATQGLGHKVVQVTSPNKGDGKSLMIANLAVMIAQSGKRVLLIDADLRRPRQHKIFALDSSGGLAVVLAGDAEAGAVTLPTCVSNLSLMPCGPVPPNPSELLTSPRFKELLETARAEYDFVLLDTPPLLAVTDPCIVAGRVDGLFLTIRLTRKGRPDAERAREILAGLGVKIFGVVVNGLSRGATGIYSPNAYDYTDSYGEDDPAAEGDYYYYEEDREPPSPAAGAEVAEPAVAHKNGKAHSASHAPAKGFFSRWWGSGGASGS